MFSVKILTAYPEMFPGVLGHSIIGKALKEKKWFLETVNLHDFGCDERNSIDDIPFGGGPGMIIRPDVVEKAVNFIDEISNKSSHLIYMSPAGKTLKQTDLIEFSKIDQIVILCGRFEGVDTRAIEEIGFQEVSIGDYITAGGEVAAQVLVDCSIIPASTNASTKSLELPSITGGSLLFNSISKLSIPIPAHADNTCSVV